MPKQATKKAPAIPKRYAATTNKPPRPYQDSQSKMKSVTPFQSRVYKATKLITKGKVTTYGALAKYLNSSPRAVGQALKKNPYAPVVPCHRVVASGGKKGGFYGHTEGIELERKFKLLSEEGVKFTKTSTASEWEIAPESILTCEEIPLTEP